MCISAYYIYIYIYICMCVCGKNQQLKTKASVKSVEVPATCKTVSQGQICSDSFTCCHITLKLQIKLVTSPSHNVLTPDQPVLALTLLDQASGKVVTRVLILSHWLTCPGSEKQIPSLLHLRMPYHYTIMAAQCRKTNTKILPSTSWLSTVVLPLKAFPRTQARMGKGGNSGGGGGGWNNDKPKNIQTWPVINDIQYQICTHLWSVPYIIRLKYTFIFFFG